MDLIVEAFICGEDNFAVLVHDRASGRTASIDAPDGNKILSRLEQLGWKLDVIFTTHHHGDHVAGNLLLKQSTDCEIAGPAKEMDRIPGIDRGLQEDDFACLGDHRFAVIETPGHTSGHIVYWCAEQRLAFAGDTLFSLGCGRVFEEPMPVMWASLTKLARLPRETSVHCGHEYTEANGRFALTIEPNNIDLQARVDEVKLLRARGEITLPTTIGQELATNPFLRSDRPRLMQAAGMRDAAPADVFAMLRRRKDNFS